MKLTFRTIDPVMVLDKSKKPWEMNGNKGVVYNVICHKKVDDDVQVDVFLMVTLQNIVECIGYNIAVIE